MLMRSQRALQIRAGPFGVLSFPLFLAVSLCDFKTANHGHFPGNKNILFCSLHVIIVRRNTMAGVSIANEFCMSIYEKKAKSKQLRYIFLFTKR